jgi:hypothetical protein
VLQGKDLLLCKKIDSIMRYSGGSSPFDVLLAPKDYAGFVILINTDKRKKKLNCKPIKVIAQNSIRILIVTTKEIQPDE